MGKGKRGKSPAPAPAPVVNITITNTNNSNGGNSSDGNAAPHPHPHPNHSRAIACGESMKKMYEPLFASLDTDGSGSIDSTELYEAMCKTFPKAKITPAMIFDMMTEADLNNNGTLSLEEFTAAMVLAEGKSGLWHEAQESLWGRFKNSGKEIALLVQSASKPLKDFARQHSSSSLVLKDESKDIKPNQSEGKLMTPASVGVRFIAYVVDVFFHGCVSHFRTTLVFAPLRYVLIALEIEQDTRYIVHDILFFLVDLSIYFPPCFFGKTFGMFLFGISLVNDNVERRGFFASLVFTFFSVIFSPIEWLFLLCSGRTIAERITGSFVVVDSCKQIDHKRPSSQNGTSLAESLARDQLKQQAFFFLLVLIAALPFAVFIFCLPIGG